MRLRGGKNNMNAGTAAGFKVHELIVMTDFGISSDVCTKV
jgi:hypothetical protein